MSRLSSAGGKLFCTPGWREEVCLCRAKGRAGACDGAVGSVGDEKCLHGRAETHSAFWPSSQCQQLEQGPQGQLLGDMGRVTREGTQHSEAGWPRSTQAAEPGPGACLQPEGFSGRPKRPETLEKGGQRPVGEVICGISSSWTDGLPRGWAVSVAALRKATAKGGEQRSR